MFTLLLGHPYLVVLEWQKYAVAVVNTYQHGIFDYSSGLHTALLRQGYQTMEHYTRSHTVAAERDGSPPTTTTMHMIAQ